MKLRLLGLNRTFHRNDEIKVIYESFSSYYFFTKINYRFFTIIMIEVYSEKRNWIEFPHVFSCHFGRIRFRDDVWVGDVHNWTFWTGLGTVVVSSFWEARSPLSRLRIVIARSILMGSSSLYRCGRCCIN